MIISEKQIMYLMDIAHKFSVFLHSTNNHTAANGIEDYLEKIADQQSEKLKEIK
jgi:hypothetical protein